MINLHGAKAISFLKKMATLFTLLLPMATNSVLASQPEDVRDQLVSQLQNLVREPLPSLKNVVPGYKRSNETVPGVLIGDFTTISDDGFPWGKHLGRLVRFYMAHHPDIILPTSDPMSSYTAAKAATWEMHEQMLMSMSSLKVVARRLGFRYVISGSVEYHSGFFNIHLKMTDVKVDKVQDTLILSTHENELLAQLKKFDQFIIRNFFPGQYAHYQSSTPFLELDYFEHLRDLVTTMEHIDTYPRNERVELVVALWNRGVKSSIVPAYYYYLNFWVDHYSIFDKDAVEMEQYLKQHRGVRISKIRFTHQNHEGSQFTQMQELKQYLSEYPADPLPLFLLAQTISHSEDLSADAIAICIELLQQWPGDYRAWYEMGRSLMSYAWSIRGHKYSKLTPKKNLELFNKLIPLAERVADMALSIHPLDPDLFVLKMRTRPVYSKDLIDTFRKAAQYNPRHLGVYETAMKHSMNKWGGNQRARNYILDIARLYLENPEGVKHLEETYNWEEKQDKGK